MMTGLSREQLWSKLTVESTPNLDGITEQAYRALEEQQWRQPRPRSSFSPSRIGGEPRCARKAIYTMMGFPTLVPIEPNGVAIMRQGMAAEEQIVYRWGRAGLTIAGSVPLAEGGRMDQLRIVDRDLWITGYIDSVLDLRSVGWWYVTPVDVKSKSKQKIDDFKNGFLPDDGDYLTQLMIYIWKCRAIHDQMGWREMGLEPAIGGIILYVSRENPRHTFELWVPYDKSYLNDIRADLEQWRDAFIAGTLPARPKEWKWTEPPCRWCDWKKICKADIKADVARIDDSCAVDHARTIKPDYDPKKARAKVKSRWKER